jgi:predicted amino acid dehydrogenase
MKEIVRIGLFDVTENFQKEVTFHGHIFRIRSYGTNGDITLLKDLIQQFDGNCDIICLSNLPHSINIEGKRFALPIVEEIKASAKHTLIIDGQDLRDIYFPWSIRRINELHPEILKNKKIGFPAGTVQHSVLNELYEITDKLIFSDPYFLFKIPKLLYSKSSLEKFVKGSYPLIKRSLKSKAFVRDFTAEKIESSFLLKDFANCDVFFCNQTQFDYIRYSRLDGKTIITDVMSKSQEKKLYDHGVKNIIKCFPDIDSLSIYGFTILEAILRLINPDEKFDSIKIFSMIEKYKLSPSFSYNELHKSYQDLRKFAFIIHPLSKSHLLKIPGLGPLRKSKKLSSILEKSSPLFPGVKFGEIKGIRSESTGTEARCELYTVFETPKMMLSKDKKHMYKKLIKLTAKAEENGNKIIGLGAYTKIVGDAGVTVNKHSPIPVTTGNSLSSAATLWAADFAIKKMKLTESINNIYQGTLVIIGATGSIGKVSAKILAKSWKKLILVAPKEYKLLDLVDEIKELHPHCEVSYTTTPNDIIHQADLVITTTSAQGKKIIDIERIKPGAVICDVSRPFDIPKEDALSRPDILVIASGEVELPGDNVNVNRDIGLHGNTVYACLAETAILALEGLYEPFSLSRDLDYNKVIEIDKLARKHGVRLAAIMGHDEEITINEIELCRKHALLKRKP